jgi:hypothetical protein
VREEYFEIYGDLYEMYRRHWFNVRVVPEYFEFGSIFESRVLRWITEAIEYAISELRLTKEVRPDAKLFLLVNLHQLVVLPLLHPESKKISNIELRDMLKNDVIHILRSSLESKGGYRDNQKHEISGGLILKTIAQIWGELGLNKLEVWG